MTQFSIRKVMVTGGAGLIGSHTVDLLLARGFEVVVVDNLAPYGGGKRENIPEAVSVFNISVDSDEFEALIDSQKPDGIIHLAAQPSVKISTDRPELDLDMNGKGMIRLLKSCLRNGVQNVVFSSSGATYGDVAQMPITEATPQNPRSPYGITKLLGELYIRYWRELGVHATILRYGNVYGPRQNPHGEAGVIGIFINRMLEKQPVRIDWDGEQQKDYVYVADVARANVDALLSADNETFCIGSGEGTSVNTIYRLIVAELGYEVPIIRAERRPGDIYLSFFDCSHAADVLGWKAEISMREGIKRTIDFFRSHAS